MAAPYLGSLAAESAGGDERGRKQAEATVRGRAGEKVPWRVAEAQLSLPHLHLSAHQPDNCQP